MIIKIENTHLGTQILNIREENFLQIYKIIVSGIPKIRYEYTLQNDTKTTDFDFRGSTERNTEFEKIIKKIDNLENPVF